MTQDAKQPAGENGGDNNGPIFIVQPGITTKTLPYEEGVPNGWEDGLKKLRRSTREENGVAIDVVYGPCPRCGDQISKDVAVQCGLGILAQSDEIEIVCNCDHAHATAPKGTRGCGARGFGWLSKIPPAAP